jgi:hypothetical protein
VIRPTTRTTASRPVRARSRDRDALLIGGALAMLAVAASTVLLVAQATQLERSLRAG